MHIQLAVVWLFHTEDSDGQTDIKKLPGVFLGAAQIKLKKVRVLAS
jgi:hypothetical protein